MINLRQDQIEFNADATAEARKGFKSILMQAPTGFGKSVCAAAQVKKALGLGKTIIFVVPKRDLVRQMSVSFAAFDIPHSFIAAGYEYNPFSKVYICTQGSIINRLGKVKPVLVFIDETHIGSDVLGRIIAHYKSIGAWIIGLSATPQRLDGRGLDCWYETIVRGPSVRWLIDNGHLSDFRAFAPSTVDLTGIKTVAGDYAKGQLDDRMKQDKVLVGDAAKHYKLHAMGKLGVGFGTSIEHIEMMAAEFNAAGIPSASIDGRMNDVQRKQLIRSFARRELLYLMSVDLLHTGFDLASNADMDVTVECMSDLRPTQSLALQSQKFGRVLRRKKEPALIFDHAGNIMRHGFPDEPREWKLEGREKRTIAEKTIAIKQCPKCFCSHRPAPRCPSCGFVHPVQSRMVEQVEGDLQEIKERPISTGKGKKNMREYGNYGRSMGLNGHTLFIFVNGMASGLFKDPDSCADWAKKKALKNGR